MKIIRWFLSHFFLILLIVAVIYGYMFWGNLAGENTPAGKALAYLSSEFVEVEEFIKAVKAKQVQLSTEKIPTEQQQAPDEKADKETDTKTNDKPLATSLEVNETVITERNITQQPVSISYSHNQMRVKQNSVGDIESRVEILPQAKVAAVSAEPDTRHESIAETASTVSQEEISEDKAPPLAAASVAIPDKFVSPKVERQLSNVDKNGKLINKSLPGDAIRESWITARKSFYQRRYELSEQSYQNVIDNTIDNFDAYGELGNVYFNQGKNKKAAKAYFEAASILVRKGQIRRARSLIGLLRHLDKNKADDLQKLIDSAVS